MAKNPSSDSKTPECQWCKDTGLEWRENVLSSTGQEQVRCRCGKSVNFSTCDPVARDREWYAHRRRTSMIPAPLGVARFHGLPWAGVQLHQEDDPMREFTQFTDMKLWAGGSRVNGRIHFASGRFNEDYFDSYIKTMERALEDM